MSNRRLRLLHSEEDHMDYPVWEIASYGRIVYSPANAADIKFVPIYNGEGEIINEPLVLDGYAVQVVPVVCKSQSTGQIPKLSHKSNKQAKIRGQSADPYMEWTPSG